HAHLLHLCVREHGHGERDPAGGRRAAADGLVRRDRAAVDPGGIRDPDEHLDAQTAGGKLNAACKVRGTRCEARSRRLDLVPRTLYLLAAALLAVSCATPPKSSKYYLDDGPPDVVPGNMADVPEAVPRDEPFHKFAN